MQKLNELFYEELTLRFLMFFKDMAKICEEFIEK